MLGLGRGLEELDQHPPLPTREVTQAGSRTRPALGSVSTFHGRPPYLMQDFRTEHEDVPLETI